MAKYSFKFKKKVVMSYLNGEGSFPSVAERYNIPAWSNGMLWIKLLKSLQTDLIEELFILIKAGLTR